MPAGADSHCSACRQPLDGKGVELAICCGADVCARCWEEDRNCPNERCERIGKYWRREPDAEPISLEDQLLPFVGGVCCGSVVGQA